MGPRPTSWLFCFRKKPWWRVPICLSDIFFRSIERKRCENISRLGFIGEQQALLATSLVETRIGKKNFLLSVICAGNYRLIENFSLNDAL